MIRKRIIRRQNAEYGGMQTPNDTPSAGGDPWEACRSGNMVRENTRSEKTWYGSEYGSAESGRAVPKAYAAEVSQRSMTLKEHAENPGASLSMVMVMAMPWRAAMRLTMEMPRPLPVFF